MSNQRLSCKLVWFFGSNKLLQQLFLFQLYFVNYSLAPGNTLLQFFLKEGISRFVFLSVDLFNSEVGTIPQSHVVLGLSVDLPEEILI